MTALLKYQRLEATGVWRPAPRARLRDVIVTVGDATLVLMDPRSETPLTHWSLPAVTRLNPGQQPAIYGPGETDSDEILEIEDPLMVAAIEKVQTAIDARRGRPGRLRALVLGAGTAALALAAALWLPGAVVRHAATVSPPAQRAAVGQQVLAQIEKITGPRCHRAAGSTVLDRLSTRIGMQDAQLVVLPATLRAAHILPGHIIVLGDDLLAAQPAPDVVAGHVLAADSGSAAADPMADVLAYAGFGASLSLLLRGTLPDHALDGYATMLLDRPVPVALDEPTLERFALLGIAPEPYLQSADPERRASASWKALAAAPVRPAPKPILSAGEWTQLRQICDP